MFGLLLAFTNVASAVSIDLPAIVEAGHAVSIRVEGAAVGRAVWIGSTTTGLGVVTCPPLLGGACIDLDAPSVHRRVADRFGNVDLTVSVPPGSEGTEYCVQVVSVGAFAADVSEPLCTRVTRGGGSDSYGGHEYAFLESLGSRDDANRWCADRNMHMLTIEDPGEHAWIAWRADSFWQVPDSYWLGISDEATEGTWLDLWGEPLGFTAWGEGEPNDLFGVEDCAMMSRLDDGLWTDVPCYDPGHAIVCEAEGETEMYDNTIYLFVDDRMSWGDAELHCEGQGMTLAVPNSREENEWLQDLYERKDRTGWLGISDEDVEGTWRTVGGDVINAGDWRPGEPNDAGGEDCVTTGGGLDGWNDEPCSVSKSFICER